MGKKEGKKQKIAYSEAKYDFQVPKLIVWQYKHFTS